MIFIFDKKYNFIGEVSSIGAEVDNFLIEKNIDKDSYIILASNESYKDFSKNYKFSDGGVISLHRSSESEMLDVSIEILLESIDSDVSLRLKTGVYIEVLKSNICCNDDNISYIRNIIDYCGILSLSEFEIYDTYNNPIIVSVKNLKSILNSMITFNVKLKSAAAKFKTSTKVASSADEVNKLYMEALNI